MSHRKPATPTIAGLKMVFIERLLQWETVYKKENDQICT